MCFFDSVFWEAVVVEGGGVIGLVSLGSFSCIAAPALTIGVDDIVHEDANEEPLFHDVPVPQESLFLMAMGRQPPSTLFLSLKGTTGSVKSGSAPAVSNKRHALSSSLRGFSTILGNGGENVSGGGDIVQHKQDVFAEMTPRSYAVRKQSTHYTRSR